MRKLLLTFVALVVIATAWATEKKELTFTKGENQLKVENVSQNGFDFTLSLSNAYLQNADTEEGDFFTLKTQGFTKSFALGNPNLPVKSKLIEVPFGAEVKIEIVSQKTEIVDLGEKGFDTKLYPCQPSVAKCGDKEDVPFRYNEDVYAKDDFYAQETVAYEESGIMRGTRLGRIVMHPFEYNPVTNQLKVYTELDVKVTFDGADMAKTDQMNKIYGNPYFKGLLSRTMNHQVNDKPLNQHDPVKMIIIADRMFETSLEPFVEWKTMTGIDVTLRFTDEDDVGSTTSSIKSYLQGVYDAATTEDPAPSFVLLVGDIGQIPAYSGDAGSHVSDLYYFCYDGSNDNLPDINYGRFSAQTVDELDAIINKTLHYEKYEMEDPSYLDHTILVAGDDESWEDIYGNGAMWYVDNYYFNEDHGITSHLFLQDPPNGNAAVHDSIINNVNNGIAWGNYTAHCGSSGWGTPSFTTSDVPSLTNDGKYGVLVGNCCLSNKFDDDECFGEALLRAENKGAIGYMGGSNSTYWDEDYWWAVGNGSPVEEPAYEDFGNGNYDLMFHENPEDQPYSDWTPTQSQVNIAGNLAIEESSSTRKLYYWEIYHLMGDPSLIPYAGEPDAMNPNYLSTIPIGVNSLDITGVPEYARVALSDEGTLIATTTADENGSATLEFEGFSAPTTADLVIIAQFHQPYIGTLEIVPSDEPFVVLNQFSIDDADGNGNGMADYNESIALNVNLKNVAEAGSGYDAASVEATISTEDPYITISDNSETYGDIAAGDSLTVDGAFAIDISDTVPDGHIASLALSMTGEDGKYTWESTASITINAPAFQIGSMTMANDDDGNDRLDPGETADMTFEVCNTGHADAGNVINKLSAESPYLTIMQTMVDTSIAAQDTMMITFSLDASSGTPHGTPVELTMNAEQSVYTNEYAAEIVIGQPPEIQVGEGSTGSGNYPFYTYYENNKTQMLYQGSEIGAGTTNIQQIGFNFTGMGAISEVQNLSIKFLKTDMTELGAEYVTESMTEVFSAATYTMPTEQGWHAFDIDDFEINVTNQNLLVEITWGDNGEWESPEYTLASTNTDFTSVAYGYADSETPPAYDGNSSTRPNLMLYVEGEAPGEEYTATFTVNGESGILDNATVYVGTMGYEVDDQGQTVFDLYEGDYYYSAEAPGYISVVNQSMTLDQDKTIEITLSPDAINSITARELQIYPNPADESVTVNISQSNNVNNLYLVDLTGKTVATKVFNGNQTTLDLSGVAEGIYILRVQNGEKTWLNKLIVQ